MATNDKKANAYNTSTSDTSFRRTWDRAEYAAKAAEREAVEKEESKARYEAKLAGKKYYARATTPEDAKETESRTARLDVASNVGKTTLVPAGSSVGKRGRGAGFYCDKCDLTFKDNLQWVDHLNSRQHLMATGQSGEVKVATLQEVQDRLAWLKRKLDEEAATDITDLQKRLEVKEEEDEKKREEKRAKRREKRRKTPGGIGIKEETVEGSGIIC